MRSIAWLFALIALIGMAPAIWAIDEISTEPIGADVMTATIERTLTYQGILKDNTGDPVGDGNYNLTFRIYDAASNGTLLWTSPVTPISTSGGYFSAFIGPIQLPFDVPYFLSIQVQGDSEMGQRQKITLAPYSAVSDTANYAFAAPSDGGSNWNMSGNVLYMNNFWGLSRGNAGDSLYGDSTHTMINLGAYSITGNSAATTIYGTIGGGQSNSASADYATIGGGSGNLAYGRYSFVGGGLGNEAESTYSAVSGGRFNRTFEYGFIGGGHGNLGIRYSSIGGGNENMALGEYSVVSGGSQNEVRGVGGVVAGGAMNSTYGDWTFIGGGVENLAIGNRSAIVGGEGSVTNNPYSFVGGGVSNAAYGDYSAIPGGRYNYITDTASVICGGAFNRVSGRYSFIGGGMYDTVTAILGGVASGRNNRAGDAATDTGAFVGGGLTNMAGAKFSSIGGGYLNEASGNYSAVFGGLENEATGSQSFIGGGDDNTASGATSAIGGGRENMVSGDFAFVGGGSVNSATADRSVACGGLSNVAGGVASSIGGGYNNEANGYSSAISGGQNNTAQGDHSSIGGGFGNYAAAVYSMVCGGSSNANSGGYSTILGGVADTMGSSGDYSLIYGNNVYNNNDYRVIFFDAGHPGSLNINRDGYDGTVNTYPIQIGTSASNGNGAYLSSGGTWTNGSSRTFKENFTPYIGVELLSKISSLSLTSYNYINSTEKHFGPVAEEFVEAFDTGVIREDDGKRDDMYLSAGDVAGVALAGVQELIKEIEQLKKEIAELKAQAK